MSRAAVMLLLFASPMTTEGATRSDETPVTLTLFESDGQAMCSLRTENAPLERVLAALTDSGRVRFDGLDPKWQHVRVTANLRERTLSQALAYVLGSVSLRAELRGDALTVRSEDDVAKSADDLNAAALASYVRMMRDFPEHPLAADAQWRQAQIEDSRGNTLAGRALYQAVANNYPHSPLAAEALLRAGEAAMRERDWQAASESLLTLMRKPSTIEIQARARLDLARCFAMLGQHERALYALDALEALRAPETPADNQARKRVRVRALSGLSRSAEALRLLGEIEQGQATDDELTDLVELRALACEAAHMPADAARAWLAFAERCDKAERERALCESAEAALEAGDELGVLFVVRTAKAHEIESPRLVNCELAARRALALETGGDSSNDERLEDAQQRLDQHDELGALTIARALHASRSTLEPAQRIRLDRIHARALLARSGAATAIEHVRVCLDAESDVETRRHLYLLAAEVFELEDRLDDAIDAYRGRL